MGKKKTKGKPPLKVSEEYGRFRSLLRRLMAVPRKELEGKMAEHKRFKNS